MESLLETNLEVESILGVTLYPAENRLSVRQAWRKWDSNVLDSVSSPACTSSNRTVRIDLQSDMSQHRMKARVIIPPDTYPTRTSIPSAGQQKVCLPNPP